jgi:peptide/nickel transport system substrate-binding protein
VTLRLRGVLAEAWQMDPQGMWLRAKIRDNARFSDGEPVTAEDFRWTFHDYLFNRQIEAERDRSYQDKLKGVKVISDKVVEFEFVEAAFSNETNALGLFCLPKHFYSKFEPSEINKSTGLLMGSGPYKLENLDPANQWAPIAPVVLVRNEQYWGTKSPLERLRFKAIDQELQRLTEYKNGLADMITPSAPQYVAQQADPKWVEENQNLSWVNMRSGRSGIIWNCAARNGKPTPFGDKRVRQAMTLLLDREKMVRDVWKGVGQVCKGFANPGTLGDNPATKPWPYDPARGAALLKEVGWEDRDGNGVLEDSGGREFSFEVTSFGAGEIQERIATFLKDAYAAAGVRVTIRSMDWAVGEPVRQQRDFDAMLMGWGANAPESDPKQIFHSASIQNQGDNFAQWNSPEADKTIDAARAELNTEKRAKLWQKLEEIMHEEQPYTWIRVAPYIRFVKKDIKNVNTYPKGLEAWEFWRGGGESKTSGL